LRGILQSASSVGEPLALLMFGSMDRGNKVFRYQVSIFFRCIFPSSSDAARLGRTGKAARCISR
jgi:hypothetical protein